MGPPPDGDDTDTDYNYCNRDVGDDATYSEEIESDSSAYKGYVRRIQMSGCPNHQTASILYGNEPIVIDRDIEIPAYPCFADTYYNLTCESGTIGVTLNGISILSRYQGGDCGNGEDNNAIENEHLDFDQCGGHASDSPFFEYHYHIAPSCLLDQMGDYDNVTSHSPLIGWAYDGFPVYGPHSIGGVEMYPCDHTNASSEYCLDDCGGTSQYEIDGFLYHYHLQGPLSDLVTRSVDPYPDESRTPYTMGCWRGVPLESNTGSSCVSDGFTTDYSPTETDGVTAVYELSDVDFGDESGTRHMILASGLVVMMVHLFRILWWYRTLWRLRYC